MQQEHVKEAAAAAARRFCEDGAVLERRDRWWCQLCIASDIRHLRQWQAWQRYECSVVIELCIERMYTFILILLQLLMYIYSNKR